MRVRVILLIVLLASVTLGWWMYRDVVSWEWIAAQESRFHASVAEHPIVSFVYGFFVYVALSLVPGTTGKSIVYGWLYGFWLALLIASTALTIAAVISLMAIRFLFRDFVEAKLAPWCRLIDDAVMRNGPTWLVTIRLLHAPYTLTNYASGATAIPVTTFAWTTQLGMLPGTIAFVLAGSSIPSLRTISEQGIWGVVDVQLLMLLSLLAFLPFFGRWVRRRHRDSHQVGPGSTGMATGRPPSESTLETKQ
ncbi:SNARE associated Golgi protein [Novipirellula aureliae]|uniref:TVP38/TMEM64 family membrane protein n=1 Tax=Novipirellula aureliae TaxID=2527966 RepID=A0A5C6E3M0_9BACT|nr:VTT domain-containing protein [Novipirellula aureliae]TWU43492.1 SNARE associated Golgi protein [Novipirellula aureliae]